MVTPLLLEAGLESAFSTFPLRGDACSDLFGFFSPMMGDCRECLFSDDQDPEALFFSGAIQSSRFCQDRFLADFSVFVRFVERYSSQTRCYSFRGNFIPSSLCPDLGVIRVGGFRFVKGDRLLSPLP